MFTRAGVYIISKKLVHVMPQLTYIYYSSAIKNGYESDSTLTFKRREDVSAPTPQTPSEAKSIYSQIQKGGDIPVSGLRMTIPERPKGKTSFHQFPAWTN